MPFTLTTRRGFLTCASSLAIGPGLFAQRPHRDYDESKVRPYTLPDPLRFDDGRKVKSRHHWNRRRVELIHLFEENMYGKSPGAPSDVTIEADTVDPNALGRKAVRKLITIHFRRQGQERTLDLLMYLPKKRTGSAPVFVDVNFTGIHMTTTDPGADYVEMGLCQWARGAEQSINGIEPRLASQPRAVRADYRRGIWLGDLLFRRHVYRLQRRIHAKHRTAVLSTRTDASRRRRMGSDRGMGMGIEPGDDYFEIDADVDRRRVALMGHSRMGKTALWAGARDTRFAMVISNCSGAGGATIARRRFGESVKDLWTHFPWWFCENYAKFADNEDALPVGQHELLALSAPRPLYIAVAQKISGPTRAGSYCRRSRRHRCIKCSARMASESRRCRR